MLIFFVCVLIVIWLLGAWVFCIEAIAADEDWQGITGAVLWPLMLVAWAAEAIWTKLMWRAASALLNRFLR